MEAMKTLLLDERVEIEIKNQFLIVFYKTKKSIKMWITLVARLVKFLKNEGKTLLRSIEIFENLIISGQSFGISVMTTSALFSNFFKFIL